MNVGGRSIDHDERVDRPERADLPVKRDDLDEAL
jgi:hypothetical protein